MMRDPLACQSCEGTIVLARTNVTFDADGRKVTLLDAPCWRCADCGASTDHTAVSDIVENVISKIPNVVGTANWLPLAKRDKFVSLTSVPFEFDAEDYYLLPGLCRPWDSGHLIPVFFDIDVLTRYMNNPGFTVAFATSTYGSIAHSDWMIDFGINSSRRVLMWLGDIGRLPDPEQRYLSGLNIESDHDIRSDFYVGQVLAEFSEPSGEALLLQLRKEVQVQCLKRRGFDPFKTDTAELQETFDIRTPIHFDEAELELVYSKLNKLFIETLKKKELVDDIQACDSAWSSKGLGSLKVFEKWLSACLNVDGAGVALPFFVIYDLRVVHSHHTGEESVKKTIDACLDRLDLSQSSTRKELYEAVREKLAKSLETIVDVL